MVKLWRFAQFFNFGPVSLHLLTEGLEVQDILPHLCLVEECLLQEDVGPLQEDQDLHQGEDLQLEEDEIDQEVALLNQDRNFKGVYFHLKTYINKFPFLVWTYLYEYGSAVEKL